jgi:hypothetical protein
MVLAQPTAQVMPSIWKRVESTLAAAISFETIGLASVLGASDELGLQAVKLVPSKVAQSKVEIVFM